jgi:acyl-CoA thioesterase FadM
VTAPEEYGAEPAAELVPAGPVPARPVPAESGADLLVDRLPYRIVRSYRVRFEEATAAESMRTAIYLAWAADVAWQHSTLMGFGRDWYSARDLYWLVRALRIDVHGSVPTYGEAFTTTQVTGYRRIGAHRHSEVRDASGELIAVLEIDWVMTNGRGVPTRVPQEMMDFVADSASTFEMLKVALPPAPADAAERRFRVHRRDLDPLDHVNNSVYLDYFEEALEAAGRGPMLLAPRRYEIDFVAAAEGGDLLVGRTWPLGDGLAFRLSRDDGTEVFRGTAVPL